MHQIGLQNESYVAFIGLARQPNQWQRFTNRMWIEPCKMMLWLWVFRRCIWYLDKLLALEYKCNAYPRVQTQMQWVESSLAPARWAEVFGNSCKIKIHNFYSHVCRLCGCSRQFFLSYIHLGCYPKKDPKSIRPLDPELNTLKDANELQNPTKMLNPQVVFIWIDKSR